MRTALPEQSILNKLLSYDSVTGVLVWKARGDEFSEYFGWSPTSLKIWNKKYAGEVAHVFLRHGYVGVTIDGVTYFAHRIIWKMVYGVDPDHIDHIDGDRGRNSIDNLRDVDAAENQRNRKVSCTSKSGVSGVHWCKTTKAWVSRIKVSGRTKSLGRFKSFEDAVSVRKQAEKQYGFHENNGTR